MINLMQFSLLKQEINTKISSCKVQSKKKKRERERERERESLGTKKEMSVNYKLIIITTIIMIQ